VDAALIVFVGDGTHDNPNTVIRAEPQQETHWLTAPHSFTHARPVVSLRGGGGGGGGGGELEGF